MTPDSMKCERGYMAPADCGSLWGHNSSGGVRTKAPGDELLVELSGEWGRPYAARAAPMTVTPAATGAAHQHRFDLVAHAHQLVGEAKPACRSDTATRRQPPRLRWLVPNVTTNSEVPAAQAPFLNVRIPIGALPMSTSTDHTPQDRVAEVEAKLAALRKLARQVRAARKRYTAKQWAEVVAAGAARRAATNGARKR